MTTEEVDVVVVGGGPVGLALAGDLGWRGRTCLLLEQGDGSIVQAKMDGVGIRTMEFCRRWGIVQDVEASAYNRAYPQDNVYLTSLLGYEIGREPMPAMQDDRPPPESPQKRERCPQNMFDPVLQRFAQAQPGVRIRHRHRFVAFSQDRDGVSVQVQDLATGQQRTLRSRFLVGCDGGRSAVRELLGIGMQGRGVLTHTVNVIFRCPGFNRLHDKQPGYRYMFVGEHGVWGTIVAINGNDQWRMSIIGNATERPSYTESELEAFAHRALGREFELEILSVLPWTRIEQVADGYGRGRVFIAGDACHLTSPTGGLGMNTGIGDAVDLSWKLAACLEGWGGPRLLDSYEIERRPIAHRITRFSTGNLETMQHVPHTARIFDPGPAGDEARRQVGDALRAGLRQEWFSKNMHLGNRYVGSPVCVYDEMESPERIRAEYEDAVNYRPGTRPGCRAPHVWMADGRSTLDLFGQGYVLMSDPSCGEDAQALAATARALGVPLTVVPMTEAAVRGAYAERLVLVRPDGHVAWRGAARPADPRMLLAAVTGNETREMEHA
ncbi:2-polyprenyl-6-methoxyphenol hydroxylase [Verticiella sediminum]|uniref:2-polyprenyl-6-methoxyphenol hydroxylase n=1 Tax=Verticiella sediminum TaxID=1247510 RepID=A0A556AJK0_9BURK|nr:FAD-dependent oxidoreductase [Verticiella sediminum]TSH93040.1 2-polyprenyl-6-methoxyphenol hydroxylase [Verticiella sediminum]